MQPDPAFNFAFVSEYGFVLVYEIIY